MKQIFENAVLDELFETRTDGFEPSYIKKYGKKKEAYFIELEKNIKNLLNNAIPDIETKKVIGNLFTELRYEERNYWNNAYYKLGIVDGIKIAAEARKVEKGMK